MKTIFEGKYRTSQNYWCAVLDPSDCTKRYLVNYGGWNGGAFKTFWLFRNALKFAKSRKEDFVFIYDEMHCTSLTLRTMRHIYGGAYAHEVKEI